MYYIVETKEQLEQLSKYKSESCFINVISNNDNFHPVITNPCLVYYNDGEKGYILPINHSEGFKLNWDDVKTYIASHDKVYVLDKKYHMYFLDHNNLHDLNFVKHINEAEFDTKVHTSFYNQKYYLPDLNCIIPICKHYEKWENIYKILKFGDINEFLNNNLTKVFHQIEKSGLGIDPRKFSKHFEVNWKNYSIFGNTVYSQYNLYNLTTRPSNAFNGVNFAALPKDQARESFEPNNYVFVEFDYSAYHPRIIAKLIDYKFEGDPYDEIPKEVMFQNIYGGIREEYEDLPFFKRLYGFLGDKYKTFAINGGLQLACGKIIHLDKNTHANRNKLLSYLIQSYETYYNTITLERVLKLLEGKKSKIVLYTYDSILLDIDKSEIKKLLPLIKQELEADGFPTRMSIGENYGALIKK